MSFYRNCRDPKKKLYYSSQSVQCQLVFITQNYNLRR